MCVCFRPSHLSDHLTSPGVCDCCGVLRLFPQVLAYGHICDRSSSVTHSLHHTTHTPHMIHFQRCLLRVSLCELWTNKPSQLQYCNNFRGKGLQLCNALKRNKCKCSSFCPEEEAHPGCQLFKSIIKQPLTTHTSHPLDRACQNNCFCPAVPESNIILSKALVAWYRVDNLNELDCWAVNVLPTHLWEAFEAWWWGKNAQQHFRSFRAFKKNNNLVRPW